MDIIKDNRKTDIIYVDKANLQYAKDDEIIKLVSGTTAIDTYVKIIAGAYNLNKYQIAIIKYLMTNSDIVNTYGEVSAKVARVFAKSPITIARSIEDLRNKKLAIVNIDGEIKLSSNIESEIKFLNHVKFVVIEVNTNDKIKHSL